MRELWAVIANEWMKLLRRRRFYITGLLSLLILAIYGMSEYHSHQNYVKYSNFNHNQQMQISSIEQQITQVKQSNDPHKSDMIANLRQQLSQIQETLKQNAELQGPNWRHAVQKEIDTDKQNIASIEKQPTTSDIAKMRNQSEIAGQHAEIAKLQYNLDHNVKPLPNGTSNPYSETINFFSIASMIFFPMVMVILVSDMIAGESTSGTIKLLLVRPVSRAKILLGKWIVSIASGALWTILLCAAIQAISMAVWGATGSAQPILTGVSYSFANVIDTSSATNGAMPQIIPIAHYDHAVILPEWTFFVYASLLMVLAMVVVATITFLFSTLFRSAMASTATAMGIVVIGFVITKMASHASWLRWVFATHLDLAQNWTGGLSLEIKQNITLDMGILVLCIWGVVSLCVSLFVFAKRDILNA
ncbi:ABC transporter permease subunit [Alicyclobacillus dauci]|uniref:ABC transporter permease subunit n=1 Tax=Alicyclobacillus dauci TaxID=1475485 RepID=A0ABY6YYU9_9BACL|nr:ABC transporter permease subunit [Alicyclobacillus dauci]WAH35762.1 ABC transporter permease subunit [Alicyclobacillus dauci]